VPLVQLVLPAQQVHKVLLDIPEVLVRLDRQDQLARPDHKDLQVQLDLQVLKVRLDHKVHKDRSGLLDLLVLPAQQDQLDRPVRKVQLGRKDQLDTLDL